MAKIIVIGGGFGGLNFVRKCAGSGHDILLIDKKNHHLFQPLLYQVATAVLSPADIAVPIRDIFKNYKNVKVLLGDVVKIDKKNKKVVLKSKKVFSFDHLVVAVGARHSYFGNDEWEMYAGGLKTVDDAVKIRERILLSFERAEREADSNKRQKYLNFVVVGGGPTGVEMAGSIADIAYKNMIKDFRNFNPDEARVYLIEAGPKILPMFSDQLAEKAWHALNDFGVIVRVGERVTKILKGEVYTNKDLILSENIIWAAGNQASPLLQTLDVECDSQGRVKIMDDCSVPNFPNIFVIGDAAFLKDKNGTPLPGIAPVAIQQAAYVANIVKKGIPFEKRSPFQYFNKGIMATIGKSQAVVSVGSFEISGLFAWLIWCFIHLIYLIGYRNRILVLVEWIMSYLFNKKGSRLIVRDTK